MPFPPGSDIDEVADLHAELVEYDGHIAGLLFSDTPKRKIPPIAGDLLQRMKGAASRHPDCPELELYITRMNKIEQVLKLARHE